MLRGIRSGLKGLWTKLVRKRMLMNGDVVVCSVSQDEFIEDIGRMVLKGDPVHIPGELAHRSRDLNVLLSQSRLVRLNVNPLVRGTSTQVAAPAPEVNELYSRALLENEQLKAEINRVRAENTVLRTELTFTQRQSSKLKEELGNSDKLDAIMKMLKDMPTGVVVQSSGSSIPDILLDDMPMYIPSQIKSESTEGRVSVAEESSDGSALSGASKALKEKRKKQQ